MESKSNDKHEKANNHEEGSSDEYNFNDNTWIHWFCSLKGNEYFCQVDREFALDRFNLTGLGHDIPLAQKAYDLIVDDYSSDEEDEETPEHLEASARHLYGLIHQRYIITPGGLSRMLKKFQRGDFGQCPRVFCRGQNLLPVGLSDIPKTDTVKLYCSQCEDVYNPKSLAHNLIDGAYFGTTFPHLFFQAHASLLPEKSLEKYTPRIFGFKLAKEPTN